MSTSNPTKRKRRRWWLIGLLLCLAVIAAPVGYYFYLNYRADRELKAAIAELDKSDPKWRLEDILASWPALADEENGALQVMAASSLLPKNWNTTFIREHKAAEVGEDPYYLPPPYRLSEWQFAVIQKELLDGKEALPIARKLRNYETGRFPVKYSADWISTPLPNVQKTREIAALLQFDAMLRAHENKCEEAWQSCESQYRVSTSLGNCDAPIKFLIRVAIRAIAVTSMERVLAQGEVSEESLARLQSILKMDLDTPTLWIAMRGDRAGTHQMFRAIESGKLPLSSVRMGNNCSPSVVDYVPKTGTSLTVKTAHAWLLREMTKAVEVAKLPAVEKANGLEELEKSLQKIDKDTSIPVLAKLPLPSTYKVHHSDLRSYTQLRCAVAAMCCERLRLRHKRWPANLEQLVKMKLLEKVPLDPYSGEPLHYLITKNGINVFSVGNDQSGEYDGAALDNMDLEEPRVRIESRVWNPDKRRQPPRPPKQTTPDGVITTDLWTAGQDGYHTYRIPALLVTQKRALLAFCEGRKDNARDHGDIDLLVKRSTDNGATWSKQQIVYEEGGDKKITIGNPCPVVDESTGVIWLPFTRDNEEVFITHSKDDGITWAKPVNITKDVKKKDWGWYATGPGVGIQLRKGKYKGRLVIPCDHRSPPSKDRTPTYSHIIYSDDHGKTWRIGGTVAKHTNECQVVEREDGALLINMRNLWGRDGKDASKAAMRATAISKDGGETWTDLRFDPMLIEPICQASFFRYRWKDEIDDGIVLFANPASKSKRANLMVRMSHDDGKTWPVAKAVTRGPAAYSSLARLPNGEIGCLYETGERLYQKIVFARLPLAWLRLRW